MKLFPSTKPEYQPLNRDAGESGDTDSFVSQEDNKSLRNTVLVVVSLLCGVANALVLYTSLTTPNVHRLPGEYTRQEIQNLRRPSQYIRFEEVARPPIPLARSFSNFPTLITQIDAANPSREFDENPKSYMSHTGTIYPEDRRFLITNDISSVVQFRAIDYGMEICELHLQLPATDSNPMVSLYRLDSSVPLNGRGLIYRTRPKRVAKIAEIMPDSQVAGLTHWHRKFSCSLEEVLTFEVTCSPLEADSEKRCLIEWWQLNNVSAPGIYMIQHATI